MDLSMLQIIVAPTCIRAKVFFMMKSLINLSFAAVAAVGLGLCLTGSAHGKVAKPNIVLFFIDDLGWADIGVNGSTFYETPHIDKLANGGVNFTHSYSANPVCSPTRAALMTGKAPQWVGITQWVRQPSEIHLKSEEVTLAEVLQKHGYVTGYIGKWHIGEKDDQMPSAQGFSWMKAVNRAGQPASYYFPFNNTKKKKSRGSYWDVPDLEGGKEGDYLTDSITDFAIEFIDENKGKGKPFYLNLAHYAVHTPIQPPKELVAKYAAKRKKMYGDSKTPTSIQRYGTMSRERQDHIGYAAMMENLDMNVGRVVDHLEKNDLLENTILIFTSDNGGHCNNKVGGMTCNRPLKSGKGWTYEGGIRVPHIVSWKGKISPRVSDVPAITMDHFPTLLEMAGLPLENDHHLDGKSLKSAMMGEKNAALDDRFLAWTYPHKHGSGHLPSHAIRKDGWKLIRSESGVKYELYHLLEDVGESKNLAAENSQKVAELDALLTNWIKETTPKTPIFK
jgi:arylsulfatase A